MMKCCYKVVDANGVIIGVEGVHDHEVEDYFDTDHNVWYIATTYEEYIEITQEEYDESVLQFFESLSPDEISAEEFMSLLEEVL